MKKLLPHREMSRVPGLPYNMPTAADESALDFEAGIHYLLIILF